MRSIIKFVYKLYSLFRKGAYRVLIMPFKFCLFKKCGKKVIIGRNCNLTYNNITIGNDVSIGENAVFMATRAEIIIGDHVMFGPHVFVITGGHRLDLVGRIMKSIKNKEKLSENDKDVVFKGDNWIGANSIILKGVVVGQGSVIAAGSVVTKDIEPYSIYGGVPAKKIKMRFSENLLCEHKRILGDNT